MKLKQKDIRAMEAKAELKKILGETLDDVNVRITAVFISKTTSGMTRKYKIILPSQDYQGIPNITNISELVGHALQWKVSDDGGELYVSGCGMDTGFHTVYTLLQTLYGTDAEGLLSKANALYAFMR